MGNWWSTLRSAFMTKFSPRAESATARWLTKASPFDYPVLHLGAVTEGTISTSTDQACAELAISWEDSWGGEFDASALDGAPAIACDRRYPVADPLPEGILFFPRVMEEKWVLAYRQGRLLAARSWTGEVCAVAETRREGGALVVHSLRENEKRGLATYGDSVDTFDWLIRSHALGQALPLPMSEEGAEQAQAEPMGVFTLFGSKAVYAATEWSPTEPARPLRTNGEFLLAVRSGDLAQARKLWAKGAAIDAPGVVNGYTPLYFAVGTGNAPMLQALLEWGANPNHRADDGAGPLMVGVGAKAPLAIAQGLVSAGADAHAVNNDGFGCLHAAAEVDHHALIPWLISLGLDREARTKNGHTAVHIAAGLGHLEALKALIEKGANPLADSPNGTAMAIAKLAGHKAVVKFLKG